MNLTFWVILIVVLVAIFGGAFLTSAAWLAWFGVVGIIIGGLARLLVSETGGYGLPGTILAGLAGSLIGGAIAHLADAGSIIEFLVSILAAAVLIVASRATAARSKK